MTVLILGELKRTAIKTHGIHRLRTARQDHGIKEDRRRVFQRGIDLKGLAILATDCS